MFSKKVVLMFAFLIQAAVVSARAEVPKLNFASSTSETDGSISVEHYSGPFVTVKNGDSHLITFGPWDYYGAVAESASLCKQMQLRSGVTPPYDLKDSFA